MRYHFDFKRPRENMKIESPIVNGLISDWDAFEALWNYSLENYIKQEIRESPILMAEKPYNPPSDRQRF